MDVVVKGRHTEVSDRFRQHVAEKLAKVGKLDTKVIRVDVEVIREHNPRLSHVCERVELTCRSRGPVIRAEAAADDPYAALDLAYAKLEERLRRAADRRRVHHGNRTPVKVVAVLAEPAGERRFADTTPAVSPTRTMPAASEDGADLDESAAGLITDKLGVHGDGPLVVREKVHAAEPITLDQALFEMELVGHDFYLFADKESGHPSVVYRRRGYDYGVIRLQMS